MKKTDKLTTPELLEKLKKKYSGDAYAFLTEVRSQTGFTSTSAIRSADAMVMSLWPSRGLTLSGFELKVSRSDWMHEFKDASKAEQISRFCDYWWVVVPDESIIQEGELPETWGLMVASGPGRALKILKVAPKLNPQPIDRSFLASLLRNVTSTHVTSEYHAAQVRQIRETAGESWKERLQYAQEQLEESLQHVRDFEQTSGIRLSTWGRTHEQTGQIVKDVLDGKYKNAEDEMIRLRESALRIAKFIDGEMDRYGKPVVKASDREM